MIDEQLFIYKAVTLRKKFWNRKRVSEMDVLEYLLEGQERLDKRLRLIIGKE